MPESAGVIAAWAPLEILVLAVPEYVMFSRLISRAAPNLDVSRSRRASLVICYLLLGIAYTGTGLWTSAACK